MQHEWNIRERIKLLDRFIDNIYFSDEETKILFIGLDKYDLLLRECYNRFDKHLYDKIPDKSCLSYSDHERWKHIVDEQLYLVVNDDFTKAVQINYLNIRHTLTRYRHFITVDNFEKFNYWNKKFDLIFVAHEVSTKLINSISKQNAIVVYIY